VLSFDEVIATTRAVRRFTAGPVPDEVLGRVLAAGNAAPSGGNTQPWRFLVVRSEDGRRFLGDTYARCWQRYIEGNALVAGVPPAHIRPRMDASSAGHLASHLAEVPVLLLVGMAHREHPLVRTGLPGSDHPVFTTDYASVFPAIQNVLLACRAEGLGAVLTTIALLEEAGIKAHFGVPPEVELVALLPIGWPKGRFAAPTRGDLEQVVHRDVW